MDVIILIGLAIVVIAVGIALSAVVGASVIAAGINTAIDINENTGGKKEAW